MAMNRTKSSTTLYCFSPPIMLATILIETVLAVYALIRYRYSSMLGLIFATLILLALFQLAEYQTCGGAGLVWSRLGYIAITLLPPLGLHLIAKIAAKPYRLLKIVGDTAAGLFIIGFGFGSTFLNAPICAGNYVVFSLHSPFSAWYGYYYIGLLLFTIGIAIKEATETTGHTKNALYWVSVGYLIFLIPTGVVNAINPATVAAIPSIMCGFAVLYALILVGKILPLISKPKT
ncbi:MAG: hypothetical protein ACHQUB_03110 [Candidatus Saccharimonadia bacterium]